MEPTVYMILYPTTGLWLQDDNTLGRFKTARRFDDEWSVKQAVEYLGYGLILEFRPSDFVKEITPAYQYDEAHRLKGDIFALETAYSKSEDMNEFLLDEIKELEIENEDLKAICTNLKREIMVIEERLDLIYDTGVDNDEKLMAEIGVLRQTIDELGEDNDELMAENARLDALVDENIELRARVSELAEGRIAYELANGRIAELEDQVEKYSVWATNKLQSIQTLSDTVDELRAELTEQRAAYDRLWDDKRLADQAYDQLLDDTLDTIFARLRRTAEQQMPTPPEWK